MVNLKEIHDSLKEFKDIKDKLKYLRSLIESSKDKNLIKKINEIIESIKKIDEIAQIETRGKVEWSLPEDEPREERRLENQIAFVSLPEEEKKEEKKIDYGLQSNIDLYSGRISSDSGVKYEGVNRRVNLAEGNSFIDRKDGLIRRADEQFMGMDFKKNQDDLINPQDRYHLDQNEMKGYASLSEEFHDKEKKRLRH